MFTVVGEHVFPYLRERYPTLLHDLKQREHFHHRMFHGFDFDNTMLRIGSMNMLLHGVESPDIRYRDSLAQDHAGEEEKLDAVLSLPGGVFKPYAGVSTAILVFTKTNSGGTDVAWFYDVETDGWSARRQAHPAALRGQARPGACLSSSFPRKRESSVSIRGRTRQERPARRTQ